MKLPLWRIAELIEAEGNLSGDAMAAGYSIDSRTIAPGELFFAVRGQHLDGHDFVPAALERGAIGAVVARAQAVRFPDRSRLLLVEDTLAALQHLGAAVRRLWGKTLIAVTGSAGKTTTKEAIAHILAPKFQVFKSQGNLNNHFGLPLQLLRLKREDEIGVIELGMSHAGEIAALAKIAQPEIGVVTLVAPVHLEFFNSIADIARAKYELIESLPVHGVAVLNGDDPYVSQFGRDFHGELITFGIKHPADVQARDVQSLGDAGSRFAVEMGGERAVATLPLIGEHNIYNALAAIAAGVHSGVSFHDAVTALAGFQPYDKRGQLVRIAGATVINDCYNSNPKALDSMVDALAAMPAKRRIVVAGEMLELGPSGEELHRASGRHVAAQKVDVLIGVRGLAQHLVSAALEAGTAAHFVSSPEDAGAWLRENAREGDAILLKASRGVKLERALEVWQSAVATKA